MNAAARSQGEKWAEHHGSGVKNADNRVSNAPPSLPAAESGEGEALPSSPARGGENSASGEDSESGSSASPTSEGGEMYVIPLDELDVGMSDNREVSPYTLRPDPPERACS